MRLIFSMETRKSASNTVRGSQGHFIPMEVARSIVAALQLVTSEIYETGKVAHISQFHNIHSDLDTALRQSERSPEKAALSPVPLESTH